MARQSDGARGAGLGSGPPAIPLHFRPPRKGGLWRGQGGLLLGGGIGADRGAQRATGGPAAWFHRSL